MNDRLYDGSAACGADSPGPLSRLLHEVFDGSLDEKLDAWKEGVGPGDRVGRFQIRREVGRGGFGAVYEALDTELNRVVAVKTLRLSFPRHEVAALAVSKEAEAVARLDHPCIVTLHDAGSCESGPYLVMELLRGRTLERRIAEGPILPTEALRIAEDMARGLAHAHERGVLHRDLKPANVFLCDDGRVKLLDFGIAHLLGADGPGGAGTPTYMAPEQALGAQVDQRADVYAAGKVLGEMLGERRSRRLARVIGLATSKDVAVRPRDGQAWLGLLRTERRVLDRPAWWLRVALLAAGGITLGALVAWLGTQRGALPSTSTRVGTQPSIAVLPFTDLSPDKDQEYFADGITDEILVALSKLEGLRVPGRASSFWFKGRKVRLEDVAKELDVTHVLDGSVRRSGDTLRVTAEVVSASSGVRLWSQTFDRKFTDIFAIQDEIAQDVARALRLTLDPARGAAASARPNDPEAYRLYLLGKHLLGRGTPADETAAVRALKESVRLDPNFAPARAWLAFGRWAVGYGGPGGGAGPAVPESPWSRANAEALRAADEIIALDPSCPDGHWLRGTLRTAVSWEWAGGLEDLRRAQALDPRNTAARLDYARALASTGHLSEALAITREVITTDPLLVDVYRWMGWYQSAGGDPAEGARTLQRGLEIHPGNPYLLRELGFSFLLAGRQKEAQETFERNPVSWIREMGIALVEHDRGRPAESRAALDRLAERNRTAKLGVTYQLAQIQAWRGETDEAFAWLDRACTEHDGGMIYLPYDPLLRSLRSDPRYRALLGRMNLPED